MTTLLQTFPWEQREENLMDEKLMTIGEIAKEANVSIRTIHYYDQCGLLKASAYSEGGYRLYSNKELVMLFQIKGLKELGLSLNEIKQQLVSFDVPEKVLEILKRQKRIIAGNIQSLQNTFTAIELLEDEITKTNSVNFGKYADAISSMGHEQESLWLLDIMGQDLREHVLHRFDKETGVDFYKNLMELIDSIIKAQGSGATPKGAKGQKLISSFWDMVVEVVDGNVNLFPSLNTFADKLADTPNEFALKWTQVEPFISEALEIYFQKNQIEVPNESKEE